MHRHIPNKVLQKATAETFRTPDATYKALFEQFPFLVAGAVCDPSAGDGRFIEAIIANGNTNAHALYDIRKTERLNWKTRGLLKKLGEDNCQIVPNWLKVKRTRYFDSVITNPPFSLACEFVEKGLRWVKPNCYVTVLHRLNWLGTGKRSTWQESMPLHYVIIIANRPTFEMDDRDKNVSDTYEYAFFAYRAGYSGEPIVKWCHVKAR